MLFLAYFDILKCKNLKFLTLVINFLVILKIQNI